MGVEIEIEAFRHHPYPPKPPYDFVFESQEEAHDFAERAKGAYGVAKNSQKNIRRIPRY